MAQVGLSRPFYAKYNNNNGTVTYSAGGSIGKAVECSIEPADSEADIFYADNGPAESANSFSGGTLTVSVDRLDATVVGAILGITPAAVETPAGTTLDFSANAQAPYLGFGIIVKNIVENAPKWMAIILTKIQFSMPTIEAETQGETIEFSGHELTATILRDDTAAANWQRWGFFDTEADAVTWIKGQLSIT